MSFIGQGVYPELNLDPGCYSGIAHHEFQRFYTTYENYRNLDTRAISTNPDQSPSKVRKKLLMFSDLDLERKLQTYVLEGQQLLSGGFPTRCEKFPGYAVVFDLGFRHHLPDLNPEAQEFVPAQQSTSAPIHNKETDPDKKSVKLRECKRCSFHFPMDNETGDYIVHETCHHHPGKYIENAWECCGSMNPKQKGCMSASSHVWSGFEQGYNGPLAGFVETQPLGQLPFNGFRYGVYALDCEMAFTKRGMDVIKVTVVSLSGNIVYDEFVKPDDEIVDCGTEIHGITKEQVMRARKTLWQVQRDLLQFIYAESIIVGHGVNFDLRVLRIIHNRIIDTSYVFPHYKGFPRRLSLRTLAKGLLQLDIHAAGQVHDSIEDARAAMDVMLSKLEHDFGLRQ